MFKSLKFFFLILIMLIVAFSCSERKFSDVLKEKESLKEPKMTDVWMNQSPVLWGHVLPFSETDATIETPKIDLKREKIGKPKKLSRSITKWLIKEKIADRGPIAYADVTNDCKGLIDLKYALTPSEWGNIDRRARYFSDVNKLIEKVAKDIVKDLGGKFEPDEIVVFTRALKALVWKESTWNHYLRYKDWFFVVLSSLELNKLSDWGITQIARSGFSKKNLINKQFFDLRGYCSIYSSLYYGFLEFYFKYQHAKTLGCNKDSFKNKMLGTYNSYFSGFSSCHATFSKNEEFASMQREALNGFLEIFDREPWKSKF